MDINIIHSETPLPTNYAYSICMTIKSFKGRKDVDVHLFRSKWTQASEEKENWQALIASNLPVTKTSRAFVMECFSSEEHDCIINYLKEQYSTRLSAIRSVQISYPIPPDISGLSHVPHGKDVGLIDFEKIPNYTLGIPLKGLYDLSQHPPIVGE